MKNVKSLDKDITVLLICGLDKNSASDENDDSE